MQSRIAAMVAAVLVFWGAGSQVRAAGTLPILIGKDANYSSARTGEEFRLLIQYSPAVAGQDYFANYLAPRYGTDLERIRSLTVLGRRWDVVRLAPRLDAVATASRLRSEPGVAYVERDWPVHVDALTPNDPYFSYQWHYQAAPPGSIDLSEVWDEVQGRTFATVVVAVVDTGIAFETYKNFVISPDFTSDQFVSPYNVLRNNAHPNDDNGHGTHVSGTIAERTDNSLYVAGVAGILNNVKLMPVKVLNSQGSGYDSDVATGVTWAADHGANIINLSLGSTSYSQVLSDALQYAANHQVLSFCAAGNDYLNGNPVEYPAADPNCTAIGAVGYDAVRAPYSSTGSWVALAAPGGNFNTDLNHDGYPDGILQLTISSTNPSQFGLYFYEGTSMATPHACGVAALIMSLGLRDPAAVRALMTSTARDLGTPGWDAEYGYGLINMGAILAHFSPVVANSDYDDVGLFFTSDSNTVYISSTRPGASGKGNPLRLWVAQRDPLTREYSLPAEFPVFTSAQEASLFPNGYGVGVGAINSGQTEMYLTVIDGSTSEIWYSTRSTPSSAWGSFAPLPLIASGNFKSGAPFLTADGLTLYYTSDQPCAACLTDEFNLWIARRSSGQPPTAFALDPNSETILASINTHASSSGDTAHYDEFTAALSSDQLTLIYASDVGSPGDTVSTDLYTASRPNATSSFGPPLAMGPNINGEPLMVAPFLSPDGKILFFTGYAQGTQRHFDVYQSSLDHGVFTPSQPLPDQRGYVPPCGIYYPVAKSEEAYAYAVEALLAGLIVARPSLRRRRRAWRSGV